MTVSRHRQWLRPIIYVLIVATAVYLPRNLGWTQPMEMFFYDLLIRLRPAESTDERIVIVGLTEEDIENLAQLPVADNTLAQLIDDVRKHNPRVIGIDLHRNVPTGDGYNKLKAILRSTPNIVGIEKTNQGSFDFPAIMPNPEIEHNGMSSASDLVIDSGDVIRRGYLYVDKNSESLEQLPSFGLKVALEYLKKEDINPSSSENKGHDLKLGSAIFPRLENNREFYQEEDIDNYQIIINFRSSKTPFKTISFSEVLDGNFNSSLLEDKIVLIGANAPTLGDNFFTPKSRKIIDYRDEVFGIEIHAHQTSQIISAALDERKIIKLLPSIIESIWILFWIVTPFIFRIKIVKTDINTSNFYFEYALFNTIVFMTIILIGYLFLLFGYWIPLAHPIIALILSAVLSYSYIEISREKQLSLFFKMQLHKATEELAKAQNELIAKEKFKAYEKLSVKMAHEIRNYLNSINIANSNCQHKLKELELFLEDNSFLFEDIYELDNESPKYITNYLSDKFNNTEKTIKTISLIVESILAENTLNLEKPCSTDINQLIERVLKESNWVKIKNDRTLDIKIKVNYASNLPEIKIVPIDLERVLINLLANAEDALYNKKIADLEYTPSINITTIQEEAKIKIIIKDNGIGISKSNIDKIFAPFWTTKGLTGGVGVGLFFSQQRIEKYNGIITVKSLEKEWSEFTLTLSESIFNLP